MAITSRCSIVSTCGGKRQYVSDVSGTDRQFWVGLFCGFLAFFLRFLISTFRRLFSSVKNGKAVHPGQAPCYYLPILIY